ncbi:hypothetical protein EDD86DRAFT_219455 [Gorgonomyces haynaldii]|nr:hypothetical protein EDD86DRAFT_219455 [Gorgonomyces haynaldii]
MEQEWKIHGHPTSVFVIENRNPSKTLLFVPGNPGLSQYYHDYLLELDKLTNHSLQIYCISQAGHDHRPTKHPLTLEQQIQHKIAMVDILYAKHPELPLIIAGHSLGSYMSLEILHRRPQISKMIGLFPTLHSMRDTPRGQQIKYLAHPYIRMCVLPFVTLLTRLPRTLLELIVIQATGQKGLALKATVDHLLVPYHTVSHALFLAHLEMEHIRRLPLHLQQTLDEHQQKIYLTYSPIDGWCPIEHYKQMKTAFPDVNAYMCDELVPHAFVEHHSKRVAELTHSHFE